MKKSQLLLLLAFLFLPSICWGAGNVASYTLDASAGGISLGTSTRGSNTLNILSTQTTGNGELIAADSLTSGKGLSVTSASTAGSGSGSSYIIYAAKSGANTNASHTAYGLYSTVTNTGTTGTNTAAYLSASGAATNYGLIVANGLVGIGTSTPATTLQVGGLIGMKGYTVGTLPTGVTGAIAYVTDQLTTCAVPGATLTGSGAITCPVFYNGSAWVGL